MTLRAVLAPGDTAPRQDARYDHACFFHGSAGHRAYQKEIAIFVFSITAKDFSHCLLPDEDHLRPAFLVDGWVNVRRNIPRW
jgi:hypothetical protein